MPIRRRGTRYTVTSGATHYVGTNSVTSGDLVYGFGAGGTDQPALDLASGGSIVDATVSSGGVVGAAAYGTTFGGTALESGSFAALNEGTVVSATVTSRAGIAVGTLSGYQGGGGRAIAPHLLDGGQAIVGGGYTIKGQTFIGSGIISGGTFDVGSTEQLTSGGTDSGSLFGGTQIVSAGGTALNDIFSAGVQIISGGLASATVVSAGGTVMVDRGGTIRQVTVGSKGLAVVSGGGVAYGAVVQAGGGVVIESGGTVSGSEIASGGSEIVESGGVLSGATIDSGGTQMVEPGATVRDTIVSAGGSMVIASGATVLQTVVSGAPGEDGPAGLLIVEPGAVLSNTSVGWKGRIDIDGLKYSSGGAIRINNNVLTVTLPDGSSWSTVLTGSYRASDFHLEADRDGSTILSYDKCFLEGTLIRTPEGSRAVETLSVGDRVSVLVSQDGAGDGAADGAGDGRGQTRSVVWVGATEITADPTLRPEEAGYPIRFRAGSLAEHVPERDLVVTPEHCLHIDGALVPARMLVNGESIAYDLSLGTYRVHHFRTESHAVIWANACPAETLLDDVGTAQPSDADGSMSWTRDAAAPLRVDRAFVEPVYRRLAARAGRDRLSVDAAPAPRPERPGFETPGFETPRPEQRGFDCPNPELANPELQIPAAPDAESAAPGVYLEGSDGNLYHAARQVNDMIVFRIPTELDAVRIRSDVARPSETVGPFLDDRRDLGVLIGDIHLWDTHQSRDIDIHLTRDSLDGWHDTEAGPLRWTRGNGLLPLGKRPQGAPGMLGLTVKARAA